MSPTPPYTRRPRPWHPPRLFPRVVCLDAGCGVVQQAPPARTYLVGVVHVSASKVGVEAERGEREGEREEGVRGGGGGVTS